MHQRHPIRPSDRRPGAILAALALALAAGHPVAQAREDADSSKRPSYPIADEARAFVDRYDRMQLLDDEVFVGALRSLAESDLTPEAKADAFALMQERIGWLFVGAARVFPGTSYTQTIAMMLTTYFEYQQEMPEGIDIAPLLDLARDGRADHPLRASNALLLATILNQKAAVDSVRAAIDADGLASAPVPAIDLHNLAFAASLSLDPAVVLKLLELLPGMTSEESREDLIAVSIIHGDPRLKAPIETFVRENFPELFDNSIQTALIVLAAKGPPEAFSDFYKSLGDLTDDEEDIDLLRKFWDDGFQDRFQNPPEGTLLKVWDGFTITLKEKEGAAITFGDSFRAWISFE